MEAGACGAHRALKRRLEGALVQSKYMMSSAPINLLGARVRRATNHADEFPARAAHLAVKSLFALLLPHG